MKQPNGCGSITKLSGKRRKPYMVRGGTDYVRAGKGMRREQRPIIGYFTRLSEAQAALAEYNKAPTTKITMTWQELYDEWKSTRAFTELSKDTQNNYTASWRKRLSALAKEKVKELRTGQLQEIIDMADDIGMSFSSISKDKALMTILFDYALQNDIVVKNYAKFVELPANDAKKEKSAFTDIELKHIEKAAETIPFADCILMMCYTGFRISEFLSLTRFSFDRKELTLTGGAKTEAGKDRTVPIHPKILKYVIRWADKSGDTLICKDDGSSYSADYFRTDLYTPALEQIENVRKLTPHCCRHTFATLLYRAGAEPAEIQRLLGHTKYQMSLHYTHTDLERLKKAVAAL